MSSPDQDQNTTTPDAEEDSLSAFSHVGMFDIGAIPPQLADMVESVLDKLTGHTGSIIDLPAMRLTHQETVFMVAETNEDEESVQFRLVPILVDHEGEQRPLVAQGIEMMLRQVLLFGDQLDTDNHTYAVIALEPTMAILNPLEAAHKVLDHVNDMVARNHPAQP